MKKSELSFKCVIQSLEIESSLKQILGVNNEKPDGNCFARYQDGYLETVASVKTFCAWPEPIMSYEEALKLIASIEPEAPEFDIKPLQPVLRKKYTQNVGHNDTTWELDLYANKINMFNFSCIGERHADCIISYPENRTLCGEFDYPAGWWECENGKPVWRTK